MSAEPEHPYPAPEVRPYDEAAEALRRAINALARFSFLLDDKGNVRRVPDRCGKWIDWQSVHEMFDCEVIDGLIAKEAARKAIDGAKKS